MTAPVLLTGGTGTLGRLVLARLREAGYDVRVLSRRERPDEPGVEHLVGDLATGDGVESAVKDSRTIVHCAGTARHDDVKARHLVEAARGQGSPHLVFVSVVGADRVPVKSPVDRAMFGYFASKYAAEQVVSGSGLPWTTVRATQFHELLLVTLRALTRLPVVPVPAGFRFQPVEASEVADRLVELAVDRPAGLVPDFGGPTVHSFDALVRAYLTAVRKRRPTISVPVPGNAARAVKEGANLTPDHAEGRCTWEQFLADRSAGGAPPV
jgi:uncharacterized protein YbjT (DUF2867 family)